MSAATIVTSIITGGVNNHSTIVEEANSYATDFIAQGVLGTITNTTGVAPTTGSFGVNQNTGSDMAISILGTGSTTNGQSVAYITASPTSQNIQVLRSRMAANSTAYTINSNSSGSTVYDWIYLKVNPTNANVPDAAADNVTAIFTSRSTSNTSDTGSPPTYGIPLAIVTVANGATSIVNANIKDTRVQVVFTGSGQLSTATLYNPYKFSVYRSAAQTPAGALIGYDTKLFDTGGNFSTSTALFTAPIAGFYQFNILVTFAANTVPVEVFAQMQKNGSTSNMPIIIDYSFADSTSTAASSAVLLQLSAADTIGIIASGVALTTGIVRNNFSGFLVSKT